MPFRKLKKPTSTVKQCEAMVIRNQYGGCIMMAPYAFLVMISFRQTPLSVGGMQPPVATDNVAKRG